MRETVHLFLYFALLRHSSQLKQGEYQFVLHYCWKFGRILLNCNMWFGCCHNGGRFSPQIHFGVPCEGTFLEYEKIPQSNTERGMTLMKLELNFSDLCQLALVVITKYFVLIDTHNRNVSNSCAYTLEQNMVGANGLEPLTPCTSSRCSSQLS